MKHIPLHLLAMIKHPSATGLQECEKKISVPHATDTAQRWWTAFKNENTHQLSLVIRVAVELVIRDATLNEFFLTYVHSGTDNIQANLDFLDRQRKLEHASRIESGVNFDINQLILAAGRVLSKTGDASTLERSLDDLMHEIGFILRQEISQERSVHLLSILTQIADASQQKLKAETSLPKLLCELPLRGTLQRKAVKVLNEMMDELENAFPGAKHMWLKADVTPHLN